MMLHQHVRNHGRRRPAQGHRHRPPPAATFPKFCNFLGHELVQQQEDAGTFLYWIRKKPTETQ